VRQMRGFPPDAIFTSKAALFAIALPTGPTPGGYLPYGLVSLHGGVDLERQYRNPVRLVHLQSPNLATE
jgi:hypothetical protein